FNSNMTARISRFFLLSIILCIGLLSHSFAQEPPAPPKGPTKEQLADLLYVDAVKARMLGDDEAEEELLRKVIENKPSEAAPYYDLARLLVKKRNVEEAERLIRKAIERNDSNV